MDISRALETRKIRRVFRDWNSLKLLGENPLAYLPLVHTHRIAAGYSDTPVGRGLALREVFQAALETLKPDVGPPNPREKRWRPYYILTDQYLHGRNPDWVQEQLHVSKGTYYTEQEKALELLEEILEKWGEESAGPFVEDSQGLSSSPFIDQHPALAVIIPRPSFPLVGREEILAQVKREFLEAGAAAVALEGLPGVGKTALAIELAHDVDIQRHFKDGILWIGLGRQPDILALLGVWSAALGLSSEIDEHPASLAERAGMIRSRIGSRRMLLIIDDAWQIQTALAFKLGGPNCAYLVTTRLADVALDFAGSQTQHVQELSIADGVRLLAQITPEALGNAPAEMETLARSVGGLPLALIILGKTLQKKMYRGQTKRLPDVLAELSKAEVRLKIDQPQPPVDNLHPSLPSGAPVSLLSVIELSDRALDKAAHQALLDLSLFPAKPNTFSERAAFATVHASPAVLDALIDSGLVEVIRPNRLCVHQTIVDYASLFPPDPAAQGRLLDHFVQFASAKAEDFEALELELNNLNLALAIAHQTKAYPSLISLVNSLYAFLETRGLFVTCEEQLARIYQIGEALGDQEERAFILHWLGSFAIKRGRLKRAIEYLQQSILLAQAARSTALAEQEEFHLYGARRGMADEIPQQTPHMPSPLGQAGTRILDPVLSHTLKSEAQPQFTIYGVRSPSLVKEERSRALVAHNHYDLGLARMYMGSNVESCAYLQESLQIYNQLKLRQEMGLALNALGQVFQELCDYSKSEEYLAQALAVCRESESARGEGWAYQNLSTLAHLRGEYPRAIEFSDRCIQSFSKIGDRRGIAWQLYHLGRIRRQIGEIDEARACFDKARQVFHELGDWMGVGYAIQNLGLISSDLGEDSDAQKQIEQALVIFLRIDCVGVSAARYLLGVLCRRHGDYSGAAAHFEFALQSSRGTGSRRGEARALANLGLVLSAQGKPAEALAALQQAASILAEVGAISNQASILTSLGQVQLDERLLDEARESCQQALQLRKRLGQADLLIEPLAGLARAAFMKGDLLEAGKFVDQIWDALHTRIAARGLQVALARIDQPFRVLLACQDLLSACQDPRAGSVLETARQLLALRLEHLRDETQRQSFLRNVAAHAEIASRLDIRTSGSSPEIMRSDQE
jgi:tetratricopeptide (TPR) repeat protein